MGWFKIRSIPIVVGLGIGMELSHTIPIVDAMGNVWEIGRNPIVKDNRM